MLPVLLNLKFIKIYTFGVFLVLAMFWGLFLLWKHIKLTSYKEEDVFDAFFISLMAGLIISRLIFVGLNFEEFGFNILKFILINGYPGLSLFGLLGGSLLFLFLIFKSKKMNPVEIFDYFAPSTFLALAIGKMGSFLAGVDVGTKTKIILAIKYVGYSGSRHLVGLYESVLFFGAVFISYKIILNIRRNIYPSGFGFYFFIFYFSAVNLLLDNFHENHLYFFGRSINFVISAVFAFLFGIYYLYFFRGNIISAAKRVAAQIVTYAKRQKQQFSKKSQKSASAG